MFADYYVPGYLAGGPIKSIQSQCDALGDEFDIYLVTRDRDIGKDERYEGIHSGEWCRVGNIKVLYVNAADMLPRLVYKIINELTPNSIHLNSLMSLRFSLIPLLSLRFVSTFKGSIFLSPRGELSKGALSLKRRRKKIYLTVFSLLRLERFVCWIASSDGEDNDIQVAFGRSQMSIHRVDNLPNISPWRTEIKRICLKEPNSLRIVFFARLSPMKNLSFLLDILNRIQFDIALDIYGPKEDLEYLKLCEQKASLLKDNVKVRFLGALNSQEVYSELKEYDLFVLPTLGENFGQAIWEALASGLPILVSDRTPWRNIEAKGIGWDLTLENSSAYIDVMRRVYSMDESEHRIMRKQCRLFALKYVENSKSRKHLKDLYMS